MQENRIARRKLDETRENSYLFQKIIIFNWSLLKNSLTQEDILDSLISKDLVAHDLWDDVKCEPQISQIDSILRNVVKNIETSDDYGKFKDILATHNIVLQTPSENLTIPVNRRADGHLRANREFIEKELYPKDQIDSFLEGFILSLEDHRWLRNKGNVRQQMAKHFLDKIMQQTKVDIGSITRLMTCFQRDPNCILVHLSKLMESDLPNGISNFIGDKDLQSLMEDRDDSRNSIIRKWTYLKENFYPYSILIDELVNHGLVDIDRADIIKEKPRREQVYLIIRNIIRRIDQPAMLSKLVTILMKENKFIADTLQESSVQTAIAGAKEYDPRAVRAKLEYYKNDIVMEFYPSDVDTFLENLVFDIDDHEVICEIGNDENKKAWCFYHKISNTKYIKRGSLDCLVFCLNNNEKLKISRKKLAELLLSKQIPVQVINRTKIAVKATDGILNKKKTSILTECELRLTVNDPKSKKTLEDEIFKVTEYSYKAGDKIEGLRLKVKNTKRSSVVVHLESYGENVKLVVEKGIVNGDLTTFVTDLLDDENIKMHMTPEKNYHISISFQSKNKKLYADFFTDNEVQVKDKMQIIKANRELLEDEYDPMPLLKSVFEDTVEQYNSVKNLSLNNMTEFKHQFREINNIPERRKRVKQFLDIAEDKMEADILWDLLGETANAFSVKKMKEDFTDDKSGQKGIRYSTLEEGAVFEGKYEVWITAEDVKSPLQSMLLEERRKKDKEKRLLEEEERRRQEEENHRRREEERQRQEAEERRRLEEERQRQEAEERRRLEELRQRQEAEERRKLEELRQRQEAEERRRLEEERQRQEAEERRRLEEKERRKRKREEELNNDVKFWKKIRTETLPRLDELKDELREANEKIRKAKLARNFTVGMTLVGGALLSIFTGGASMAGALGAAAITGGAAGITLMIETYVEKDVLRRTQNGINKDKEATYHLITRVRAYRGTDNIPFADNLHKIKLEGIDDLAKDPLEKFISSFVDTESASLLKAVDKIIELRVLLEHELQEVERIQGQHSFS